MARRVFIDTWGWIALGHRRDAKHGEIKKYYHQMRVRQTPIYSSDYILDEVLTLLFRREPYENAARFVEGILSAADDKIVGLERVTEDRFQQAWKLRLRFDDKPRISFTDLTSMVIMRELGIEDVLTDDAHFSHVGMGFRKVP